ncbi:hypothetical protein J7L67_01465, partial [bacterium]|nr:hypothetical protein [bacterium]
DYMEFDDIIKKRIMELEELLKKMVENSEKFSEIKEFLSNKGYNTILCLMTLIYHPDEYNNFYDMLEDEYFEEEIDEKLEKDFYTIVCEDDRQFLKKVQDKFNY